MRPSVEDETRVCELSESVGPWARDMTICVWPERVRVTYWEDMPQRSILPSHVPRARAPGGSSQVSVQPEAPGTSMSKPGSAIFSCQSVRTWPCVEATEPPSGEKAALTWPSVDGPPERTAVTWPEAMS